MACVAVSGCTDTKPAPDGAEIAQPYRGQEVELIAPKALQLPTTWEVLLHEWSAETGATVRWTEYSAEEPASLENAFKNAPPSGGRVIVFPLRRLSELDRHLSPIESTTGLDFDPRDLFKGLRDRVISRNRSSMAIPIAAPVFLCYYRADLLKAAGLKPPETWEEYENLVARLDAWAPGLVAVEPLGPEYRSAMFSARALAYAKHPENYSFWFDLGTGTSLMSTSGFVEAMEVASRTWKKMPESIATMRPADCRHSMLDGSAALAIGVEPTSSSTTSETVTRPAGAEIGVCRLPGSRRVFNRNSNRWEVPADGAVHAPGLCGFDGLAIGATLPATGVQHIAAQHLLSTLAGTHFETTWATLPKSPCRESQAGNAASWNSEGLSVEEASNALDAMAQTLRDSQLVADLPIPSAEEFRRAMDRCVDRVLKGESEPQAAIEQLQEEFEKIISQMGRESLRASYRRGLGLPSLDSLEANPSP